jgi:hypothetical protein
MEKKNYGTEHEHNLIEGRFIRNCENIIFIQLAMG